MTVADKNEFIADKNTQMLQRARRFMEVSYPHELAAIDAVNSAVEQRERLLAAGNVMEAKALALRDLVMALPLNTRQNQACLEVLDAATNWGKAVNGNL